MARASSRKIAAPAPGVRPPRQARGQRSEAALMAAGRKLLRRRHFDALRVEEICAAAGLTTGAFYRRFEGKDVFLRHLQTAAVSQAESGLVRMRAEIAGCKGRAFDKLLVFTTAMVRWCRAHEGVLRASLQRSTQEPRAWAPLRPIARMVHFSLDQTLRDVLPSGRVTSRTLAAAYQIAAGTVINMLINDPGPMRLRDDGLPQELAHAMLGYIRSGTGR